MKSLALSTAIASFNLGDSRLNKRLDLLQAQLGSSVGTSTPQAIQDRGQTKAYYRFINNKNVLPEVLVEGYGAYSRSLAMPNNVVLGIQDTTTLNYSTKRSADNLDCLESATDKGFMLHNHLLINTLGCPVGLFSQSFFARKASDLGRGKANKRKKTPYKEKESYRWLREFDAFQEAYKMATDRLCIEICDREADIHEVLQARKPGCEHIHYIIRSSYERASAVKTEDSIWVQVANEPFSYEYILTIPEGRKRSARNAQMAVRYKSVVLNAGYRKEKSLRPQTVWIVETREISPVPVGEDPVHWRLLTSIPVLSAEIAAQIIHYYVLRWLIERFHYVLKQGFKAEELQIKTKKALQNAIILKSWQAIDVMVLGYTPKAAPTTSLLTAGFSVQDYEIAYTYAKNYCNTKEKKEETPLLIHFTRLIAQIGGHTLQVNKPIGIVSIWRGWNTFCIIKNALSTHTMARDDDVGIG